MTYAVLFFTGFVCGSVITGWLTEPKRPPRCPCDECANEVADVE
jgi:hypothetical protein